MSTLHLLFLLSGATSLVWETLWSRQLHLIFGTSQFAIATVLCAFMGGLAIGSGVAARFGGEGAPPLIKRLRPLQMYAILEALIGAYSLAFPLMLALIEPVYLGIAGGVHPVLFGVAQFLLAGGLLLVPAACMGATLPVLTPLVRGQGASGVGGLYAINTVGAVAGVAMAGFVLLPELGVERTALLNAAGNLLLLGAALLLDRHLEQQKIRDAALAAMLPPEPPVSGGPRAGDLPVTAPGLLLAAAAVAGFCSLSMEVAWFRLLGLILGASAYAFSLMLLAFLVGIASGGALGGPLADRLAGGGTAEGGGGEISRRWRILAGLVAAQAGVGLLTWAVMWGYGRLPLVFVQLYFILGRDPDLIWGAKCVISLLIMTPPAFLMGLGFPLLIRARSADPDGAAVGALYSANTLGGVAGAFMAGFVLLPTIGVRDTVLLCVSLYLLSAAMLLARELPRGTAALAALAALLWLKPPPWDPMVMTTGVYKYVDSLDQPTWAQMKIRMIDRYRLLHYQEGLSTVVTVAANKVTGNIWLANNGKIDASTTADMPTQVLVAHLPFLFLGPAAGEPPPRDSMLIGLASGITLGAMNLHPELRTIRVVEIEPSMPAAAALFRAWNHDALNDPRVRVEGNDGRNQILLTPPASLDLIVSEPSNPWLTGVANLFTIEYFRLGLSRLREDGVFSQWVQMYGMDQRDLRAVIRTFCEVFPHVRVFATIEDADLVMVGSRKPLVLDREAAEQLRTKNNGIENEFSAIQLRTPENLLSTFLMDRDQALKMARASGKGEKPMRVEAPINTDDNLLIEYSAPRNLHRQTSEENLDMLGWFAQLPEDPSVDADGWMKLARAYEGRGDPVRALAAAKRAIEREPGNVRAEELYREYVRGFR